MKIRLSGTPGQVDAAAELIGRVFLNVTASRPRRNRDGSGVRVYLTADLPDWQLSDSLMCPWCRLPETVDAQGAVPDGRAYSCRVCRRTYAMAHGLVIVAASLTTEQVQPGDWLPGPDGWMPADGHPFTGRREVFRPSTGIVWPDPDGVDL